MEFPMKRNGVSIPEEVWMCIMSFPYYGSQTYDRWLDNYPGYFAEERLHRDKWSYVTEEDWNDYYTELRVFLDPLDEIADVYAGPNNSGGIFDKIKHPEKMDEFNKWWERKREMEKFQEKERNTIEKRVYNKHFNKYGLKWQKKSQ